MPNWTEVLDEIKRVNNSLDQVRKKYLRSINDHTGRNVIAYYSGWLQKPLSTDTSVNDKDKSGLMLTIHKMDKTLGLDLILHTPGGDIAATESLVDYLYAMFNKDIRVIVPQLSMSAGTMIALSAKSIMMGKHSNLGPIDPQYGGMACQSVIDEFEHAKIDIQSNPASAILWQTIISKYPPTFLGECHHAIAWSKEIVQEWLKSNMCSDDPGKVDTILDIFADHNTQKSHSRHISRQACISAGLNIEELESDQELQDAVLTTHHAFMHTFSHTSAVKIIENHMGEAYIEASQGKS